MSLCVCLCVYKYMHVSADPDMGWLCVCCEYILSALVNKEDHLANRQTKKKESARKSKQKYKKKEGGVYKIPSEVR